MTLRARFGVSAGLVLAVLVVVGVLLPRTVRSSQITQVDNQLRAAVPAATSFAGGPGPIGAADEGGAAATVFSDLYVARLSAGRRTVIIAPAESSGRQPQLPTDAPSARPELSPVTVGSVHGSGSWRALLLPLPDGSTVLVAVPLDQVEATTRRLTEAVGVAGLAVLLAMAAAGWWLLRLGLGPIAEMTDVADAIAGGDRSRRVSGGVSGTEAAHLARALNLMLDEQVALEHKLRRFVADASHELRTPVAAIGGFADLWRNGGIDNDQLGEVMRRIGQESSRMRDLVEDLLLLAHLDEGRALGRSPVDLRDLLADAALDASATHPSRLVAVEAPLPVIVTGDDARLRQVIANLVSNALIHTDTTARVTLRAERRGAIAILTVADDGAGIATQDAEHVFDRFWRADPSRSRSGAGLGLPIVRSIVEAHGGQVFLATMPGAGTTVRIELPDQPEPEECNSPQGTNPPA